MNPIDLTFALIENSERYNNPVEYWKKHCVNCGVLAGEAHAKDDCPPQNYEKKNATKTNPKATRGENTMTPTEQDKELRALLDEFVLYMDSSPESNEPNELKLFLEQCGFPDAIDRLYSELRQLITADRKRMALEARINERNKIALDNYRGETFSESTNWQAKFEYFMDSNERRIAELKAQQEEKR